MGNDLRSAVELAATIARECWGAGVTAEPLSQFNNAVFRLRGSAGEKILKLAKGADGRALQKELGLFALLARHGVPAPVVERADPAGKLVGRPFFIMASAGDRTVLDWAARPDAEADRLFAEMGSVLAKIHGIALTEDSRPAGVGPRDPEATVRRAYAMADWAAGAGLISSEVGARFKSMPVPPLLGDRLCHGDFHAVQCIVSGTTITAVVDWESAWVGNPLVDLAVAITYLEFYGRSDLADGFRKGYASRRPIPESFSATYRSVRIAQALAILAIAAEVGRTAWIHRASGLLQHLINP